MSMNNLGVALSQNGQVEAAVETHQQVLVLLARARAEGTADAEDGDHEIDTLAHITRARKVVADWTGEETQ
jgi:hypothetical protein